MCYRSYDVPLVADIHFQPAVAMRVADAFEKIRINPGNYVDGTKKFDELDLSEESMKFAKEEIQEVCVRDVFQFCFLETFLIELCAFEQGFAPLVEKCKSLGRAMRIGTNHGSLSNRILSW